MSKILDKEEKMRNLHSIMVVFFLAFSVLFSTVSVSEARDNAEEWNQYQRERYCERMWYLGKSCDPDAWNGKVFAAPKNSAQQRINYRNRLAKQGRNPNLGQHHQGYRGRVPQFSQMARTFLPFLPQ